MPPFVRVIVACCAYGRCSEGRAMAEAWPGEILRAVASGEIWGLNIDAGCH
jgi:hypothetical protein